MLFKNSRALLTSLVIVFSSDVSKSSFIRKRFLINDIVMVFRFPNRKYKGVRWMPRFKVAMKDV